MKPQLDQAFEDLVSDEAKVRKHIDTLGNVLKVHTADSIHKWMKEYDDLVEFSEDPDVRLKHLKVKLDIVGWGPNAKKVDNPQDRLPMFNFVLNGGSLQVQTVDASTGEVLDDFTTDNLTPSPTMQLSLGINSDLGAIDV